MTSLRCDKCRGLNPPDARFCTKCGASLTPDAQPIEDEIRQLREQMSRINQRLDAIEGLPEITARKSIKAGPAPSPEPETAEAQVLTPTQKAALESLTEKAGETQAEIKVKQPAPRQREWEQILGGNWLARIGILALIIGIGFFLKYAFDNNWLGPAARVILGVAAGVFLLWLGFHWRKRYPIMTRVLSGGGIAVQYLSIFASFAIYDLINIYIAVMLLLIISIIAALLALRYNSMALAVIGILGAFFAPFILGAFGGRGPEEGTRGQAIQLLVYLIVVDIGVLVLSTLRHWHWFTLLALVCSLLTYGIWYTEFENRISPALAETGITFIFLSFAAATYLFHVVRRRTAGLLDYILMTGTAAAYTGISLRVMWDSYQAWLGGFVLLLAIFYGILAYVAYKRSPANKGLSTNSLGIALALLTIAVPIQFGNHAPTTITWAIETVTLVWLSFVLKIPLLRGFGYILFIIMAGRLLFFDTTVVLGKYKPIINTRFLAFAIGIAAIYLIFFIIWRQRKQTISGEWRVAAPVLLITASFLTIWMISFEVWQSFTNSIRYAEPGARRGLENAQNLSLTGIWALYAVAGLVVGIWRKWRYLRIGALALLAIPIVKVFVYDVFHLDTSYRIGAFVGLGLLLLASAYLYQRYSKVIKGVFTNK